MEKVPGIRSADVTTVRIFASIKAVVVAIVVAAALGVFGVGGARSA